MAKIKWKSKRVVSNLARCTANTNNLRKPTWILEKNESTTVDWR